MSRIFLSDSNKKSYDPCYLFIWYIGYWAPLSKGVKFQLPSERNTKHQRRTFWLYKGIGMLKLGRMHRQTGEKFVDPTAMSRQMREVSDF